MIINDNKLVTEDNFINWIKDKGGVLHTRSYSNIKEVNLSECEERTLVCLTGYTQIISQFFNQILPHFTKKIILITIETDYFDMKMEYLNNPLLYHWFTWNKQLNHLKLTCIPIGLNNTRQGASMKTFLYMKKNENIPTKLFAVNLSTNSNPDRIKLIRIAKTNWSGFCTFIDNTPFLHTYFKDSIIEGKIKIDVTNPKTYHLLSEYKFILSPPGAGLDCHRTWEAMYSGCIPIVISSSIDELYVDMPVLIVKSWDQINKEFLEEKYKEIRVKIEKKEYNMDKLYFDYWIKLIENKKLIEN